MKYLPTAWPEMALQISRAARLFLFLDFDGTLAPIVRTPERAMITASQKKILRDLTSITGVRVALVSGRALSDVRAKMVSARLGYAGNHGLEWDGFGRRHIAPEAREALVIFQRVAGLLGAALEGFRGLRLENKGYSISVHYRGLQEKRVKAARRIVKAAIETELHRKVIKFRQGKKVWEIRPAGNWHKGRRILWVLDQEGFLPARDMVLFFGDDRTDEDAFRALRRLGAGVKVSKTGAISSAARYYVRSPAEVWKVLVLLRNARLKKTGNHA